MIMWFCLFFRWCGVSHWLICMCWTILVTLGWIQHGRAAWSFQWAVGFSLLGFVENFCIYIHQRYWPVIFFDSVSRLFLEGWVFPRHSYYLFSWYACHGGKDGNVPVLSVPLRNHRTPGSWAHASPHLRQLSLKLRSRPKSQQVHGNDYHLLEDATAIFCIISLPWA